MQASEFHHMEWYKGIDMIFLSLLHFISPGFQKWQEHINKEQNYCTTASTVHEKHWGITIQYSICGVKKEHASQFISKMNSDVVEGINLFTSVKKWHR